MNTVSATAESMKFLLTGASGFVGRALAGRLHSSGAPVVELGRRPSGLGAAAFFPVDDLAAADASFADALAGVEVVVHCAARAHVMRDEAVDPLDEYRRVNVEGTLNLARQAAAAGVRRFVFLSSIKVNGEGTAMGCSYRADDPPAPEDAYGISKAEAEAGLRQIARETGMEWVAIRPVLVYGAGVKGNFASLLRWLKRGWPLPLGAVVDNRRSLLALDNLVDFIVLCAHHPAAANQVFLASDGEDVSTAELLRRVGRAIGRPARLLPVPLRVLCFAAQILGKGEQAQRLLGSLRVDIEKNKALLGWTPPVGMNAQLRRLAHENEMA